MFNNQKIKSLSVSQYILEQCHCRTGIMPTPMKLLKLVYISHGYMLAKNDTPLLIEPVMAWQYGPIVNSVYQAVRDYQDMPVKSVKGAKKEYVFCQKEKEVMNLVVDTYSEVDAVSLSAATHQEQTPWRTTWDLNYKNSVIPNGIIQHFYKNILSKPTHSAL